MASFIIEGGHPLTGEITPQGAKNEALQVICATLLTSNTVIEPVFHPNGGVADFNLVIDGNTSLASTVYTDEKLAAMLEKWCSLTGQTPAHRLVNKAEEEETDKSLSTDQEQNQEIISYGKQRHR